MLRIAVIVGKMDSGGKKNLIMNYYRNLDKNRFQFDFYVDEDSNSIPYNEINESGGKVFLLPRYQNFIKYRKELKKCFIDNKYLIIHSYMSTLDFLPLSVAKKVGISYRISESLSMGNNYEFRNIIKIVLRRFSKIYPNIFFSCGQDCGIWQFGKKYVTKHKLHIFKTCIDTSKSIYNEELRALTRKELGLSDSTILFGFIGRFVKQKNPIFLLKLFKELIVLYGGNVKLLLIGDGPLKEKMLSFIKLNQLQDNIIYLGRTEEIYKYYQAMDCFLLPSLYEGLPVVGLESQCCGLPIVFSSNITSEAQATSNVKFLSLKYNVSYWAREIKIFLANCCERKSHREELIENGFDAVYETKRLENFYNKLVKENNDE